MDTSFYRFGIYPRVFSGLQGVFLSPFLHSGWNHLIDNTVPLVVLTIALLFFYKDIAFKLLLYFYLITGFLVWIFGRSSYHIGASGVIYALASFLFLSGVIRRNINLMAISLLVSFLYGSMVWGIFPIKEGMSWESHLSGALVGAFFSILYRHKGPPPVKPSWADEVDDDDNEEPEDAYWKASTSTDDYKPKP